MGSTVSMTGNDTIIINNRVMNDLADQDVAALTFENEIASVKTGKNGNALYADNQTGKQGTLVMRVVRGSADDKFLNGLYAQQTTEFSSFVLLTGRIVKNIGNALGDVSPDTYVLQGGVFTKAVEVKSNVEGDTEQSVSIWTIKFANAPRVIG